MRPLFAVANPRDIQGVYNAHQQIRDAYHTDFIYFKYIRQEITYPNIRTFFLSRPEFTHLILASDDIVVMPEQFGAMLRHLQRIDYPVISAVMNLEKRSPYNNLLNITTDFVPALSRDPNVRIYNWEHVNTVRKGVIRVKFSGFPLMFIRRDVVEMIPFEGDLKYNQGMDFKVLPIDYSYDLTFCYHCERLEIPIFADTNVILNHLKVTASGHFSKDFVVGKKAPRVVLIDSAGQEHDYTSEYAYKPVDMLSVTKRHT